MIGRTDMDDRIEKLKKLEKLEKNFDRRYRKKKVLNLIVGTLIIAMCVFALIRMAGIDREGLLMLRWMTVDGTLFTLMLTIFFFIVNIVELRRNTEMTRRAIYFTRLSSAVAESMIFITVLISQLPVFPMHLHLTRPDMFCMHIAIPILVIVSFTMNDSPLGKLTRIETFYGTSYVTFYAVIILSLIGSGVIKREDIPYGFLDIKAMSIPLIIATIAVFYVMGYTLSSSLSKMNRKLYWTWFKPKV